MSTKSKKWQIVSLSVIMAVLCGLVYCLSTYQNINSDRTAETTRTIEVSTTNIDYDEYFKQFDGVKFSTEDNVSVFNLTQVISDDFLSEINEDSLTKHQKGEICYDIEYDHENQKVFLNATIYLDNEENCLIERIEGIPCWNEETNSVDIAFDADGEVMFLSEFDEDIDNCGWFRKALKFIKKHAVAIVSTVAVVAIVTTVAVAAPAFVAAATATMSVGGGTAALGGGISAGLVAAGSAIASSTLVSTAVAATAITTGVVLGACVLDSAITLTDAYVTEFADSVKKTDRADRYILVVLSALDQPLVTHYKPVTLDTAKTWFSLGGQVWTPYSADAANLITSCGYNYGKSDGTVGLAEHNIISTGSFGYWHYHAIDKTTGKKVTLPGDGKNANAVKAHSVHCFFYF